MQLHQIFRNSANPVVLAGDSHNAWAYNIIDPNTSLPLAVEFDDPSVTPPGLDALTQLLPGMPKLFCLCGRSHVPSRHVASFLFCAVRQCALSCFEFDSSVMWLALNRSAASLVIKKPVVHMQQLHKFAMTA